MLALTASTTGPLVDAATAVVNDVGLVGIFVLILLECVCIPIPPGRPEIRRSRRRRRLDSRASP